MDFSRRNSFSPKAGTILGVLYPLSAYIHYNRKHDVLIFVSEEDHPWTNLQLADIPIHSTKPWGLFTP